MRLCKGEKMKKFKSRLLSFTIALAMIVPMFVLPSMAEDTAPQLITSPDGYNNIEIRVTTDKEPLDYRVGDKVTFTMKVYADNVHVSVPRILYRLEGDGDATHAKLFKEGYLYPDADGVFTLTEDVIAIPGYMRITGMIYSTNGSKWPETPNDSRDFTLAAGILVNYEEVYPVASRPDDFDQVWDARLAELSAVAPKILRIDKITKYYNSSSLKTLTGNESYDIYAVYIDCLGCEDDILVSDEIGNEKGATWAVAYITVPKNKTAGSMQIAQGFQGRGINTATPSTSTSNIGINMSTHSVVLLDNDNAASSTDFKNKYTSYVKNGAQYGSDAESNSSLETCYWANMLLRDVQMLRFAKQAFGSEGAAGLVDSNTKINGMTEAELTSVLNYWKGLYNGKISTSGGSQGGFQALCTAALDTDVVFVSAHIPSMADNYINTDQKRVQCNTRPKAGEALRYVETSFLARRIKASVSITAGLNDTTCAPLGVMCIWNSLVDAHKDDADYRASITFIQSKTHSYTPAYPGNQAPTLYTYEQVEPEGIPNSDGRFTKSGYLDIDGHTVDQDAPMPSTGYVQIGTNVESNAKVTESFKPSLYFMTGAKAYYNETLQKLVLVSTGTISDNYGYNSTSPTQNANVSGALWRLGYWANKNSAQIKEIEFRYGTAGGQFGGIGYFTSQLTSVASFKIDTRLNKYNWGANNSTTSIFAKMSALESAGHGTFAADGSFTAKSYEDGVIDLRGFTGFSDSDFGYTNYNGYSVKKVVTNKLSGGNMFEGCANLKTVTVPNTASLRSIGANCFKGCNRLEEINIECALTTLTIGSNAFGGKAIVINVNTSADKDVVTSALQTAGITNVTVKVGNDVEEETPVFVPYPVGAKYGDAAFVSSGYTDVDSQGWIQVGTSTESSAKVTVVGETVIIPTFYHSAGASVYFNESLNKVVIVATGASMAADYGDNTTATQETIDANKANVIGLCVANHDKIYVENPAKQTLSATGLTSKEFSADQLKKYKSAYDEAIAAGKTADEAKQAGGAAVSAEVYKWSKVKNSPDNGSVWKVGYWVTQNESKIRELEIRTKRKSSTIHSSCYYYDYMTFVESVKVSTGITADYTNTNVGSFYKMESLVSLGHGSFDTDGTFTSDTYRAGIVNLTGFSDSAAGMLKYMLCKSTAVTTVAAPRIDEGMFMGATKLEKVNIPAGFTLTTIAAKAFSDCTALDYIIVDGTVDSSVTIGTDAFKNVSGATIVVNTEAEQTTLKKALTNASVPESSVKVILAKDYVRTAANAITAEGFSVRMKSYTGLRGLFSFNETVASLNEFDGFSLVSYGVIVASYDNFCNTYGADEDALFTVARAQTNKAVKYVPVYNSDGTGANKYVNYDTRTFCVSLVNFPTEFTNSDVYMAGYAIWVDKNGNEAYTITTYEMPDTEKAVNLYEITFGLTKTGVINSQNTDDKCFWQILKNGAFSVTESEVKAVADTFDVQYTFDATTGKFTYLDQPLRAWNFYRNASNAVAWNSYANHLEETSSTNILWSILENDGELVVVYRRDPNAAAGAIATVPQLRDRAYAAYAPYSSSYFSCTKMVESKAVNGDTNTNGLYKYATIYTPVISDANEAKITTLVIDYGVNALSVEPFSNTTVSTLTTIVYPEGLSAAENILNYNSYVKNIIYSSENKTSLVKETQAKGFGSIADLSGLVSMKNDFAFSQAKAVENIILPTTISGGSAQELFYNASSLKRVWTVGYAVPEAGTLDLSNWGTLTTFDKNSLTNLPSKTKIILSPNFRGVANYSYILSEAVPCAQALGKDADYTIVLGDNIAALTNPYTGASYAGLLAFLDNMDKKIVTGVADGSLTKGQASATTADNMDGLTFVCTIGGVEMSKTIDRWRAYFIEKGLYISAT